MTNDQLRAKAEYFLGTDSEYRRSLGLDALVPVYETVLRLLDEHKLMREALEKIQDAKSWNAVGELQDWARNALEKVAK